MWWTTWNCSLQLHPLSCVRQQRYSPPFLHDAWRVLALPQNWHTWKLAHTPPHTHMSTDAQWGQHAGRRFRLDTTDQWRVNSLHFRLTQMVMVHKVCGWGGGVGADGLWIVINLCLVRNKEIPSHTNRQKLFVTPFWDSGDRCVCGWLMVMFCLKNWKRG